MRNRSAGEAASHCPSRAMLLNPATGALLARRVDLMPIDVHAHYVPHRILATLEERARDFGVSLVKTPPQCALHFDYGLKVRPFFAKLIEPVDQRLDGMAAQGASCPVLSVVRALFAHGLPSRIAARWHRLMNESLSELCHSHPGRFALFASVPLPDAAAAATASMLRFSFIRSKPCRRRAPPNSRLCRSRSIHSIRRCALAR